MIKIPISNKIKKRKIYANSRSFKTPSSLHKEMKDKKSHSSIFNYSGLNNILLKYNSNAGDNKSTKAEVSQLVEDNNNKIENYSYQNYRRVKTKREKENTIDGLYLTKLKEMNSNMDLLLTGMKSNLEGSSINSDIKVINADKFINQINKQKLNSLSINSNDNFDKTYENLKYNFSNMKICNFNFEIINKKNYIINIDKLKDEFKDKINFIFEQKETNIKEIYIDKIINLLYDYKNKFDEIKITNREKLLNYFNNNEDLDKEMEKYLEIYKIEENNKVIHKDIEFLIDKLTYSFYKGELLLNKYYSKLKEMDINVGKNIKSINDHK